MKIKTPVGAVILLSGLGLFIFDLLRLRSGILYLLAFMALVSSILTGKKIAAYLHDSHLSRAQGFSTKPTSFVYLWLFFWLIFVVLYTLATVILSQSINLLISSFRGDYVGLFYSILFLLGSYLIFAGKYEKMEKFLTGWGKTLERGKGIAKGLGRAFGFEKYL